jgi:predicted CopG family antitoxin
MKNQKTRRKQAKTFSLSEDAIAVLENYKSERRSNSLTAALEEIIRDWKRVRLQAQFTTYYDSLSDEEANSEKAWGEFSESQM